jgi:hypothetical protein
VVAAVAATGLLGTTVSSFADVPFGPASLIPAAGTPHLVHSTAADKYMDVIRQVVQCGDTMYAVGSFSQVGVGKTATYPRSNIFSFRASPPYTLSSWAPQVNGVVNTIAFDNGNCADAYIGGKFTAVGTTTANNIAEVDTTTGDVVAKFTHNSAGQVETIADANGHLLTGGMFPSINGSKTAPYFASLNPVTGRNDGYLNLGISGTYVYTDATGRHSAKTTTHVYNQQISTDGTKDLIEGVFTTVGGQPRRQVAVVDLGPTAATVDAWHADLLDQNCATVEPYYAKAAAWSPDDQTIYVATTGYKPATGQGFSTRDRRAGPCDAAIAFPATQGEVTAPLWTNYTGCDSLYAVAADTSTAYFAGHERWASNPNGCDNLGPGGVAAPGMIGLSPTDGSVTYNPTRSRGHGADDMEVTPVGLWIASDNAHGASVCGHKTYHSGLCVFRYGSS